MHTYFKKLTMDSDLEFLLVGSRNRLLKNSTLICYFFLIIYKNMPTMTKALP